MATMVQAVVHLHTRKSGRDYCDCVCGVPCGTRETTAYRNLDPERVTCSDCLAGVKGVE